MSTPSLDICLAFESKEQTFEIFFEKYQNALPIIFKVTAGYYGTDEQVFGQDEIYFVYGIHRQKRLLAKDKGGRVFSIPTDYEKKFNHGDLKIIKNSKPRYMTNVFSEWQLDTNMRWIMPERDQALIYNVDAQTQVEGRLGILEIFGTIDLKYVLAHAILDNMDTFTTTIPHYINIDVAIATGFIGIRDEVFVDWMRQMKRQVATIEHGDLKLCEEIILFEEFNYAQSHQQYEYMRNNNPAKVLATEDYQRLELFPISPPQSFAKFQKQKSSRAIPLPYFPSPGCDDFSYNPNAPVLPPRKSQARRVSKAPMRLPDFQQDASGWSAVASALAANQNSKRQHPTPPDPRPLITSNYKRASLQHDNRSTPVPTSPQPITPRSADAQHQSFNLLGPTNSGIISEPEGYVKSQLKNLGINDVVVLLKKIGLDQHESSFKEKQIDGLLLLDLLEDHEAAFDAGLAPSEVHRICCHLDPC